MCVPFHHVHSHDSSKSLQIVFDLSVSTYASRPIGRKNCSNTNALSTFFRHFHQLLSARLCRWSYKRPSYQLTNAYQSRWINMFGRKQRFWSFWEQICFRSLNAAKSSNQKAFRMIQRNCANVVDRMECFSFKKMSQFALLRFSF